MSEKCLVINAGSSSLKFRLYEMPSEVLIANGLIEKIGLDVASCKVVADADKFVGNLRINNHAEAFKLMKEKLMEMKVIDTPNEIGIIGHRIVHGGELYKEAVLIDSTVVNNIRDLTRLAPNHHPGQISAINGAIESFPNSKMVAAFDTSFHHDIPKENYMFSTPYSWYTDYGVRRYGFHGMSHHYITEYMKEKLGRDDINLIICHIGSGASITAVRSGKSFDTTMGLGANSGLMMCTRSGNLEPAILEYVASQKKASIESVMDDLSKRSGLIGVSEISSDYRDVEGASKMGNEKATLALKLLIKSAVNYIVTYYNELDGDVDAIIFTAGVGENSISYREAVLNQCAKTMPIILDKNANQEIAGFKDKKEGMITTEESNIPVFVIPTNEEIMIAREVYNLTHDKVYKK